MASKLHTIKGHKLQRRSGILSFLDWPPFLPNGSRIHPKLTLRLFKTLLPHINREETLTEHLWTSLYSVQLQILCLNQQKDKRKHTHRQMTKSKAVPVQGIQRCKRERQGRKKSKTELKWPYRHITATMGSQTDKTPKHQKSQEIRGGSPTDPNSTNKRMLQVNLEQGCSWPGSLRRQSFAKSPLLQQSQEIRYGAQMTPPIIIKRILQGNHEQGCSWPLRRQSFAKSPLFPRSQEIRDRAQLTPPITI